VADELMADALRDLRTKQGDVKFLGSYPAAGQHTQSVREHADQRGRDADDWLNDIRTRIHR
jgi:prephenate dehydratase